MSFVDWVIEHEWVTGLDDLVERRLMLAWSAQLTRELVRSLADRLVHAGKLGVGDVDVVIEATLARLREHYGRRL
jgi:hypothetical protein